MLSQTFCCINTKCSSKSQHGRRPLPPVFSFPDMHTHIHTQSHTTTAALTVYTRCHCQCRSKLSLIKCLKGAVLCKQPIRLGPHRAAVPHLLLRTLQMLYNITKYTCIIVFLHAVQVISVCSIRDYGYTVGLLQRCEVLNEKLSWVCVQT